MTERERIKAERKEYFKTAPFSKKIEFFWEYYKIHTFIVLVLVIGVGYFIHHLITAKDTVLSGLFLNAYSLKTEVNVADWGQEFLELKEIDTEEYEVTFIDRYMLSDNDATDYEVKQAIWVQVGAGAIDFMVSPLEYITDYAYQDYYCDLRTILSEEQIEKYEQYFLYVDSAVIKEIAKLSQDLDNDVDVALPDAAKPEEMENPIPVFIDLSQCEEISELYGSAYDSLVFGVLVNAKYPDNAVAFLDYLME